MDNRVRIILYEGTPERCRRALKHIGNFLASDRRFLDCSLWDKDQGDIDEAYATDLNELYIQLKEHILKLDGAESQPSKNGGISYNAPEVTHRRFVKTHLRVQKRFVSIYLAIPCDYPMGELGEMCDTSERAHGWDRLFRLGSADDLDLAMELIQQAYNYNLIKRRKKNA